MSVETEEMFEIKLNTLETLFVESATGGISIFITLALSEDDKGANETMINNFRQLFASHLSGDELDHHIKNIQEIRALALQDETLMTSLEDRINTISTSIATNLVVDEEKLMLTGDLKTKED
jgi:hypothetical protein